MSDQAQTEGQEQEKAINHGLAFEKECNSIRADILPLGKRILALKGHQFLKDESRHPEVQLGEVMANIMLAYRHGEDERMRVGKIMQAVQGGTSILDKPIEVQEDKKKELEEAFSRTNKEKMPIVPLNPLLAGAEA